MRADPSRYSTQEIYAGDETKRTMRNLISALEKRADEIRNQVEDERQTEVGKRDAFAAALEVAFRKSRGL